MSCELCGYKTSLKGDLNVHKRGVHKMLPRDSCSFVAEDTKTLQVRMTETHEVVEELMDKASRKIATIVRNK